MNKLIRVLVVVALVAGVLCLAGSAKKVSAITDTRHGAIIRLHADDSADARSFCSGTVISDTIIVTAAHCVPISPFGTVNPVFIRDSDKVPLGVMAMPLFVNPRGDVALLVGDFTGFRKIKLSKGVSITMNRLLDNKHGLRACGYPWSAELVCVDMTARRFTYVDGIGAGIAAQGWLMPGMSGGPVIDEASGELVGVNTATANGFVYLSPVAGIAAMFGLDEAQL